MKIENGISTFLVKITIENSSYCFILSSRQEIFTTYILTRNLKREKNEGAARCITGFTLGGSLINLVQFMSREICRYIHWFFCALQLATLLNPRVELKFSILTRPDASNKKRETESIRKWKSHDFSFILFSSLLIKYDRGKNDTPVIGHRLSYINLWQDLF